MAALKPAPADDMSWLNPEWRKPPAPFTLIRDLEHGAEAHDSFESVAARVEELRQRRGLQAKPMVGSYAGSETFEALNLYAVHRQTGDTEWLGTAVVHPSQADALRAAIHAHRQKKAA